MTAQASSFDLKERNTFSVGFLIALSSWTLIFFTLIWGYAVYRLRSTVWLEAYITPKVLTLAVVNTAILALSSLALRSAFKQKESGGEKFLWSGFSLGILFLFGQLKLWQSLLVNGLRWDGNIAGSFMFLLTGFHALHVIGGLIALAVLCARFPALSQSFFASGAKRFWDFLLVIWLVMFALIFILK